VITVPPESGLESGCDSRNRSCFIHTQLKIVSGLTLKDI